MTDTDLFIDKNVPISEKLWKSEEVCTTVAHYPHPPDATTNKFTKITISNKPAVKWPTQPSIDYCLICSDGYWYLNQPKWTNREWSRVNINMGVQLQYILLILHMKWIEYILCLVASEALLLTSSRFLWYFLKNPVVRFLVDPGSF